MSPRVSVIVPLYNLRDFVAETLDSVLAQTLPPEAIEIIVVDDGSTDASADVVRRYGSRVRYVRQENRGLSAARNTGIRLAGAPLLSFLDGDDRVLPEKIATQLDAFAAHPAAGLVYTWWHYIDAAGRRLPQRGRATHTGDLLADLVLGNLIHPHTALVRRDLVEAAGGFDEALTSVEDWDLWLRLSRAGAQWHCIPRPLAEYRIRHDGMHRNPGRMLENRLRVLAKVFADPDLPAAIVARRALAYQSAYLAGACDFFRIGDRVAGGRCFHEAVAARPAFITEPASLRRFCRLVLPQGHQREAAVVANRRPLARILHAALADLFAHPDLDPGVRRLRRRAAFAYWRTVVRLARKRVTTRQRPDDLVPMPLHHEAFTAP